MRNVVTSPKSSKGDTGWHLNARAVSESRSGLGATPLVGDMRLLAFFMPIRVISNQNERLNMPAYEQGDPRQKIQRCLWCDEPTGHCEDDTLNLEDVGPLCERCYADAIEERMTEI